MAAPQPLIQASPHPPRSDNQPPLRILDNPPASSVAGALANSKRQVDAT